LEQLKNLLVTCIRVQFKTYNLPNNIEFSSSVGTSGKKISVYNFRTADFGVDILYLRIVE